MTAHRGWMVLLADGRAEACKAMWEYRSFLLAGSPPVSSAVDCLETGLCAPSASLQAHACHIQPICWSNASSKQHSKLLSRAASSK